MKWLTDTRAFAAKSVLALILAVAASAGFPGANPAAGQTAGEAALQALIDQAKKEPNAIDGS